MKIIYMGTPDFAVPSLEMLTKTEHQVAAVVTQPDKPKGRKMVLTSPPVKIFALSCGIKVLQPEKISDGNFIDNIEKYKPDLVVTCAYGKKLTERFLNIPKFGTINVHASLLPKYRGAAPIQWCIINGEKKTGITTMLTDIGMDTGDILLRDEAEIGSHVTAGELHDTLSILGAKVLKDTLISLVNGTLSPLKQDDEAATHAPMIKKSDGIIDWSRLGRQIHNLVRGVTPWPGAYTQINNEKVKICTTEIISETENAGENKFLTECGGSDTEKAVPGEIIAVNKSGIIVLCGKSEEDGKKCSAIKITKLQPQSGKRMSAAEYINGHNIKAGDVFGL